MGAEKPNLEQEIAKVEAQAAKTRAAIDRETMATLVDQFDRVMAEGPKLVLASTVYELLVDTVEQEQIYAATTTPAPLVIDQWVLMDRDGLNDLRTLRTSPSFGGGFQFGGNAGDGFERPIFRVSGGIGLFGSAAMDSIGFTVLPLPQP